MQIENYLANVTAEQIEDVLAKSSSIKDLRAYVDYLMTLPEELKVLFIIRGLMYMCIEFEFDLEGEDMWNAAAFYNQTVNQVTDTLDYYGTSK